MGYRVGIATESERLEQEWRRLHLNLKDWGILGTYNSKSTAQARENQEAGERGCDSGEGGDGPEFDTRRAYCFKY